MSAFDMYTRRVLVGDELRLDHFGTGRDDPSAPGPWVEVRHVGPGRVPVSRHGRDCAPPIVDLEEGDVVVCREALWPHEIVTAARYPTRPGIARIRTALEGRRDMNRRTAALHPDAHERALARARADVLELALQELA